MTMEPTWLKFLALGCALFWLGVAIEYATGVPLLSLVGLIPPVSP